mmetsp:Transcript_25509/g.64849  ORF Transcript_25509/g.64849 Transcript_25509/m.64849 type:complete len:515 (-) Transcript_25509:2035-3579(-)
MASLRLLLLVSAVVGVVQGFTSAPLPSLGRAAARAPHASPMCTRMALKPPPGKKGFFRGITESLEFIFNGDNFVKKRVAEFGPVFSAKIFFLPTVVVGGAKNVEEFLSKEADDIPESSLPPALQALFTDNNLLLQSGERHAATKKGVTRLVDAEALKHFLPTIERRAEEHVEEVASRGSTALAKDFTSWNLQLFSELFGGCTLTEEEVQLFVDYNAGLFALAEWEPAFKKAQTARETLERKFEARFKAMKEDGTIDDPSNYCYRMLAQHSKEVDGTPFSDYKIGFGMTAMIWGAYIETASLMSSGIILTADRPDVVDAVRAEAAALLSDGEGLRGTLSEWNMPYTNGVLRECLRTNPPAGGGFRKSNKPVTIAGYDIPAGTVVTADPRPGNMDPERFPDPEAFAPERWVGESELAASKCPMTRLASVSKSLPVGAWFPGGTGVHKCPGVPMAELVCRVMLAKWFDRIGEWEATTKLDYVPAPIKIPKDSFEMRVVPRAGAGAGARGAGKVKEAV